MALSQPSARVAASSINALQLLAIEQESPYSVGPAQGAPVSSSSTSNDAGGGSGPAPLPLHWVVSTLPDVYEERRGDTSGPAMPANTLDELGQRSLATQRALLIPPDVLPPFTPSVAELATPSTAASGTASVAFARQQQLLTVDSDISFSAWDA